METLTGTISGIVVPYTLNKLGYPIGLEGVEYYSKHSKINCTVQTIFTPFIVYGTLLWLPALFKLNVYQANKLQRILYISYMVHYIQINKLIGIIISLYYILPLTISADKYNKHDSLEKGLKTFIGALTVQEFILFFLKTQRTLTCKSIINSIMYAIFFSVSGQCNFNK